MKKIFSILAMTIGMTSFSQKGPEPFKAGDKIMFAGNSITEAGFYEMYIWQYYILHFPNRRITVCNAGIGGDVAGQILARLDDDILRKDPTAVVLTFGMNDSRYFEYLNTPVEKVRKEAVDKSYESYQQIEKKLLAATNVRKIMMTSSPFDETVTGPKMNFPGKYKTMQEIAKFQREAAIKNNWAFVNLMDPMTEIDAREQKRDTNFTLTGPDRIHPGNAGHFSMAWLFLKAQGLANTAVADVAINASTAKLSKAMNAAVSNIKKSGGTIAFDYQANSLPFPADTQARSWGNTQKQADALSVIPFTEEFNREILAAKGLQSNSKYTLTIDGENIGEWTGAAWDKGINLAVLPNTPQYKQAQKIADLMLQYRELEQKLRGYYWLQFNFFMKRGMLFQDTQAALDSVNNNDNRDWAVASKKDNYQQARKKEVRDGWEKEMNDLKDKMYTLSQPVKHTMLISIVK